MNPDNELTICSVYHSRESKRLLELNYNLVRTLNPDADIRWVVANNTPDGFSEKLDPKKFIIVKGADEISGLLPWMWGSYRHSRALKNTLPHIATRYALILDIDFYILVPSWMNIIPQHMQEAKLAFFGVPWNPSYQRKWRYFPSPHTLFIDLNRVPRDQLDFEPVFPDMLHPTLGLRIKERAKFFLPDSLRRRLELGTYSDTGYPIYKRFSGITRHECPQPVFRKTPTIIDQMLPDRLSFIPKRPGYFTPIGFREQGFPDCVSEGWEEFMWRDRPYGFHIRGTHKLHNDVDGNIAHVHTVLDECVKKIL